MSSERTGQRHRLIVIAIVVGFCALVTPSWASAEPSAYHEHVPPPLHARGVTLPFEVGHAAGWRRDSIGPRYEFELALLPGYRVADRLSLNLGPALMYRNPRWDIGSQARLDYLLTPALGGFLPLRALACTAFLFDAKAWRTEGGLAVGLGTLLTVAAFGGYDTERKAGLMHLALGVDLLELNDPVAGITHYAPKEPH